MRTGKERRNTETEQKKHDPCLNACPPVTPKPYGFIIYTCTYIHKKKGWMKFMNNPHDPRFWSKISCLKKLVMRWGERNGRSSLLFLVIVMLVVVLDEEEKSGKKYTKEKRTRKGRKNGWKKTFSFHFPSLQLLLSRYHVQERAVTSPNQRPCNDKF